MLVAAEIFARDRPIRGARLCQKTGTRLAATRSAGREARPHQPSRGCELWSAPPPTGLLRARSEVRPARMSLTESSRASLGRPTAPEPEVSVVIPVFDSGEFLESTLDSVLSQGPAGDQAPPSFEILIIDDRSTDPHTLEVLERAASDPRIRVLANRRTKGVAGARNTGIEAARAAWIAFCDSDDLWLDTSLAVRWGFLRRHPQVRWLSAGFLLLRPETGLDQRPFAARSPCIYGLIKEDFDAGRLAKLERPVTALLHCGCPQVLTALMRRDTIIEAGMFDESMRRAEDYLLWLRCAIREDLYLVPADTGIYRLRPGSLTRSGEPTFYLEHQMLRKLRDDPRFLAYSTEIDRRMVLVLEDYCYHYRRQRRYATAVRWAVALLQETPFRRASWKHLIATVVGVG